MTVETTAQTPAQTPVRRTLGASAALLAVAGLGLAAAPAASAAEGTATADLSVRAETNTGSAVLATIPSGAAVDVQCQAAGEHIDGTYSTDQWGKVTHDGQTGYVSRAYLTILDANGLVACGEGEAPAPTRHRSRASAPTGSRCSTAAGTGCSRACPTRWRPTRPARTRTGTSSARTAPA